MVSIVTESEWPEIDPSTVCPLKDGRPNMYAHMPTRFVSLAEAKARGWKYFYIGDVCLHGHKAPRFVSNVRMCVDCDRVRGKMNTIGGKGAVEARTNVGDGRGKGRGEASKDRPNEPSKLEKDFLAAYAEVKDFDAAAKKIGQSPPVIEARLAWSATFRAAYDELEDRIGVHHVVAYDLDYEWDEDKYSMLIRVWIDTGDLATAREAIRVSPSEFHAERARNAEFAARLAEAKPLADQIVIERAMQDGIKGNSTILTKLYNELKPADATDDPEKRSREEMIDEIVRIIGLSKQRIAGRQLISADDERAVPAAEDDPPTVPTGESESFADLL